MLSKLSPRFSRYSDKFRRMSTSGTTQTTPPRHCELQHPHLICHRYYARNKTFCWSRIGQTTHQSEHSHTPKFMDIALGGSSLGGITESQDQTNNGEGHVSMTRCSIIWSSKSSKKIVPIHENFEQGINWRSDASKSGTILGNRHCKARDPRPIS